MTIGDETTAVDCAGQRDHSWGVRDWWQFPWNWTSGHLDDGSFFHAARSIIPVLDLFSTGYTVSTDGALTPADVIENDVDIDAEKLPTAARQRIGPVAFTTDPVGHAPVLLVAPDGRETRFPRAMCRYTTEDGRAGTGWTEYNWPTGFPPTEQFVSWRRGHGDLWRVGVLFGPVELDHAGLGEALRSPSAASSGRVLAGNSICGTSAAAVRRVERMRTVAGDAFRSPTPRPA